MSEHPIQPNSIILAADDEEDDIELLRLLFKKAGITRPFHVYAGGEEIVAAFTSFLESSMKAVRPFLCLLDVKMPGMNGHEVLRWIRKQRALDPVPVVMLSSSDHPSDVRQAAQNGAQCYLTKYPQASIFTQLIIAAERFADGVAASECFKLPGNLLLRPA